MYESGAGTYAYVTAVFDKTTQIMNITNPAAPSPAVVLGNGSLPTSPLDATMFSVAGSDYLVVTGTGQVAAQVFNLTDPEKPEPVATILEGHAAFEALSGSADIQAYYTLNDTYLIAVDRTRAMVLVLNVSDPANPAPVSAVRDGGNGLLLNYVSDVELLAFPEGRTPW